MDSISVELVSTTQATVLPSSNRLSQIALGLVVVQSGLVWGGHWFGSLGSWWSGELLLLLATSSTLCSLARQLPWQNVVSAAVLISFLAAAVEIAGIPTGIRFGLDDSRAALAQSFSMHQAGLAALVWILAILNSRGVARLLMRRRRTVSGYGFWLLGITVLWLVCLWLNFRRFAPFVPLHSKIFGQIPLAWPTLAATSAVCVVILLAVTPALINKKPGTELINWHPLVIWTVLNLLFFTSAVQQGALRGAGLILLETLVLLILTTRRSPTRAQNSALILSSTESGTRPMV